MRVRISRPRRDFGHEGFSYIERDAGESNMEIKVTKTGYFTKKKVLEIGLQAANKMKVISNKGVIFYLKYRGFHHKLTTIDWSMPSSNMTLMISSLKCRSFPPLTSKWLINWRNSLIE
jgi:hypothetical protein